MSKRLYVGNLSYSVKSEELGEVFGRVGEVVSAKVITDQESGRSKGFGFVEMASEDLGARAIEELNGMEVSGRAIRVTEANPRPERPPGGGSRFNGPREGGPRGGGNRSQSYRPNSRGGNRNFDE